MAGFGQSDLWPIAGRSSYERGEDEFVGDEDDDEDEEEDDDEDDELLRDCLKSLDHDALVDLLCEHAARDHTLHLALTQRAAEH